MSQTDNANQANRTAGDGVPELVLRDDAGAIVDLLRDLQRAILAHPEAARALFGALVREGRMFAQTADGKRWQEKVAGSALLERALLVWQSATLWMLEEQDGATPSSLVDAIASAAASPDRDLLLDKLFREMDGVR
jgi:hypothetical protein